MKASLSWLKEYISLSQTPEELSDVLTLAGLEVEGIIPYIADFSGVVSAKIIEVKPHPDASKLQIATVFDGNENIQVVCGASNCRKGLITAMAKIDARLQISSDNPIHIQRTTLRGVESSGMLCSEKELSLSDEDEGIMQLPGDFPVGISLEAIVEDTILDISLTPNLGHCLSMIGLARELKAHLKLPVDLPQIHFQESSSEKIENFIQIEIEDPEDCHQYSCRLIHGLQSHSTPWFIKNALLKSGIRSKHLVVDVLNYVMLECGQPMHAFDYHKLPTKKIVIKQLPLSTEFKTLDAQIRKVPSNTLMIFDDQQPIAIAGIMGGDETAVDESSNMILIEAAHFAPGIIRKGMKHLQLRSESSNRFEKGIDPHGIEMALNRAVALIQQYGKCEIAAHTCSLIAKPYSEKKILCQFHNIARILGAEFSRSEVEDYLHRLDMIVRFHGDGSYHVTVPSYRHDIEQEIDIIEELAKVYGYNNIPLGIPVYSSYEIPHHPMFRFKRILRSLLLGQGLQEILTCDLISPEQAEMAFQKKNHDQETISVLHAKSMDQSVLRSTFLPGFIACIEQNKNYGCFTIAGFEMGHLHFKDGAQFKEKLALGIFLTGHEQSPHFSIQPREMDFLDLKGLLENLFDSLHIENESYSKIKVDTFHPGRQAEITKDGFLLGVIGQLHPQIEKEKDFRFPVYYAQIDIELLYQLTSHHYSMKPLPHFPSSERYLTVHLPKSLPLQKVVKAILEEKIPLLESVQLTDIYESASLGPDRISATLRFIYRDLEKTIESLEVEKTHSKIFPILEEKLQGLLFH